MSAERSSSAFPPSLEAASVGPSSEIPVSFAPASAAPGSVIPTSAVRKSDLPRATLPAMSPDVAINERPAVVQLISGRSVAVIQSGNEERVEIRSASGDMMLSVRLTDQGPVFSLSGASFEIAAAKSLTLSAETVRLAATADISMEAGGALRTIARDIELAAHPGQISLRANDDVDIVGERVRLNSDDPPMPQTWEEHRSRTAGYAPFSGPISSLDPNRDDTGPPRLSIPGGLNPQDMGD